LSTASSCSRASLSAAAAASSSAFEPFFPGLVAGVGFDGAATATGSALGCGFAIGRDAGGAVDTGFDGATKTAAAFFSGAGTAARVATSGFAMGRSVAAMDFGSATTAATGGGNGAGDATAGAVTVTTGGEIAATTGDGNEGATACGSATTGVGCAAAACAVDWDGSTNDAVTSMSESASPRATIAVTRPTKTPMATSAAAQETVGRPMRTRVRAVTAVAGGSTGKSVCDEEESYIGRGIGDGCVCIAVTAWARTSAGMACPITVGGVLIRRPRAEDGGAGGVKLAGWLGGAAGTGVLASRELAELFGRSVVRSSSSTRGTSPAFGRGRERPLRGARALAGGNDELGLFGISVVISSPENDGKNDPRDSLGGAWR